MTDILIASRRDEIDTIMSNAFEKAARILDAEVSKLLKAYPTRFSRFVLAVGWGPSLFGSDGRLVKDVQLNTRARKVMDLANHFYDSYGADNREIDAACPHAGQRAGNGDA